MKVYSNKNWIVSADFSQMRNLNNGNIILIKADEYGKGNVYFSVKMFGDNGFEQILSSGYEITKEQDACDFIKQLFENME